MAEPSGIWMWGDARGIFGASVAGINPLRWSARKGIPDIVAEFGRCTDEERARPVKMRLFGHGLLPDSKTIRGPTRRPSTRTANEKGELVCDFRDIAAAIDGLQELFPQLQLQQGAGDATEPAASANATPPGEGGGGDAAASTDASQYPFRCEDRSKIPDELVQGPFEDFEISQDVYATAYLISRNATPDMYSILPWRNRQVIIVWAYLIFVVCSQVFVIAMITFYSPPVVDTETLYVDCSNTTSLASLHRRGVLGTPDSAECRDVGAFAFEAELRGRTVAYHKFEHSIPFYEAVLMDDGVMVYVLRIICCTWVFSQMYLEKFDRSRALLLYHDFGRWFLPAKGEMPRNAWVVCIPLVQYGVTLIVTTVSFLTICAQNQPFDIVMNSLAFTFIAEIEGYFNAPLVKRMAATKIEGLGEDYGEIFYTYPDYTESNCVSEDGAYSDEGWYVLEEEQKAGFLSDYKVRHNPGAYVHPSEALVKTLAWLLWVVPPLAVVLGALRRVAGQRGGAGGVGGEL